MTVGRLTTRLVDRIASERRDIFMWDSELPGFGVRVRCSGTKSYIYQYRMGGRGTVTQRYTIGHHRSPWTVQDARERARRLAKQVEKGKIR